MCYTFSEIDLRCNTCQPLGGQHGSWANLFHIPVTRYWWDSNTRPITPQANTLLTWLQTDRTFINLKNMIGIMIMGLLSFDINDSNSQCFFQTSNKHHNSLNYEVMTSMKLTHEMNVYIKLVQLYTFQYLDTPSHKQSSDYYTCKSNSFFIWIPHVVNRFHMKSVWWSGGLFSYHNVMVNIKEKE